ncbi:MAG: hypothetical protein IPF92_03620 [Myxococcales bacterium]|nr:hypothetical protein [Myxococcales bacterium]MBL0196648.1 hypothetical protein [Myxococcales bacterium]
MDLFTHVLAAGLVAEGVARVPRERHLPVPATVALGPLTFFLASLSHLALDRIPHFGFVPHLLSVWGALPHAWLVRPVVGGLLALAFLLALGGGNRGIVLVAAAGATYPDVEKMAHAMWGLPYRLFEGHAGATSSYSGGYDHRLLAAAEIAFSLALALAYRALAARRGAHHTTPPPA